MATKVISSEEEFLATFRVGDAFWHMRSWLCRPECITQATIKMFREDGRLVITEEEESGPIREKGHSVRDLTNQWHGVFTNKEDAEAYLAERKLAYETNPELIAEAAKAEESFNNSLEDDLDELDMVDSQA